MTTNDEIIERIDNIYSGDGRKAKARMIKLLDTLRADTAKQIFAELDWVAIIKDAEFKTGAYDERTEAKAYQELRDRIEYLKKKYKVD